MPLSNKVPIVTKADAVNFIVYLNVSRLYNQQLPFPQYVLPPFENLILSTNKEKK